MQRTRNNVAHSDFCLGRMAGMLRALRDHR